MHRTTRRLAGAAAALALAAIIAPTASAENIQTLTSTMSPAKAKGTVKKPRNVAVGLKMTVATPDGSQPSQLDSAVLSFSKNLVPRPEAFAVCQFSLLESNRAAECPSKSIIGKGLGAVMAKPPFDAPVKADVTAYNTGKKRGKPTIAFFAKARGLPVTIPIPATLSKAKGKFGWKADIPIPQIKTLPGFPDGSIVEFSTTWNVKGAKKALFFGASGTCKGSWQFSLSSKFRDKSTAVSSATTRC